MTTFDTIVSLIGALLPCVSVLAFLLLHRRQHIHAELEDARLRQAHHERIVQAQTKRSEALMQAAVVFAPALMNLVERAFEHTPAVQDISDEDLVAELDRRIDERDWKHGNPFAALDELLERLWGEGVDIPQPRQQTPITSPSLSNLNVEVS